MHFHVGVLFKHPIHASQVIAMLMRNDGMLDRLWINLHQLQMLEQQNWIATCIEQHATTAEVNDGRESPRTTQVFSRRRVVEHHTDFQFRLSLRWLIGECVLRRMEQAERNQDSTVDRVTFHRGNLEASDHELVNGLTIGDRSRKIKAWSLVSRRCERKKIP